MSIKSYLKISLPLATALAALILALTAISALADGPTIDTQTATPTISTFFGPTEAAKTGHSIATGDINGDGYQDLLIGAPFANITSTNVFTTCPSDNINCVSGAVYLYLGRPGINQTLDLATQAPNVTFYVPIDLFSGEELGRSVATGDLNGDHLDDIIIGVSHYGASHIGAALVWVGRTSITTTSAISVELYEDEFHNHLPPPEGGYNLRVVSAWIDDRGGWDVASDDINGDGYDDLIVGMPTASVDTFTDTHYSLPDYQRYHFSSPPDRHENGAAYVSLGSPDLTASTDSYHDFMICLPELTIYGQNDNDHLGRAVASGNLDGDGLADLIVSAENADGGVGKVYVFYGSDLLYATCDHNTHTYDNWIVKDLVTTTADITLTGFTAGDHAGYDVTVGDLDGDNLDDIIISAPNANGNHGKVYVVYGNTLGSLPDTISLNSQADVTVLGAANDTWLGTSVLAGDLNDDGIDDLLMGAPAVDPFEADDAATNDSNAPGAAYALFGSGSLSGTIDLSSGAADLTILGAANDDWLGRGLGIADLNKDGFNELIAGAAGVDYNSRNDTGAAYVINLVYLQLSLTASLTEVNVGNSVSFTTTAQTWLTPTLSNVTTQTAFAISPAAGGSWTGNTYQAANPGTWTVTATYQTASVTTSLTVIGPPQAKFTCGACTIGEGQPLAFNATTTLGNAPLTYTWAFGDGAAGSGVTSSHAYPDNGAYTATLTVKDVNSVISSTTHAVIITNRAPVIQSVVNSGPIDPGGSVTVTVTASDVASDTLKYAFNCDNNASFEIGPQAGNHASCQFNTGGVFPVHVRVSDEDGGSTQGSTAVTVNGFNIFLPLVVK